MANTYLRPYELSLWTLQDEFVTVLKWSEVEHKGQAQSPSMKLVDDGTSEFDFSIPRQFYEGDTKIFNPLWQRVQNGLIIANMHKIKVIFNKKEADEAVFEFLVASVTENHENDEVMYDIHGESLAFHELGKIGYKTALSSGDFEEEYKQWFSYSSSSVDSPAQNLQYWNDKVFKFLDEDGVSKWRYNWEYEVQMDWSSFSFSNDRDPTRVYEEEYVSSWDFENSAFRPKSVQGAREKWRAIDTEESNVYNITQTIAETFGVFCKYVYEYDDNYHITKRKVIYYNNYLAEAEGHLDITYPYHSSAVTRVTDNTDVITKLFVRAVDSDESDSNLITIMNVDANKTKEDYLLDFDYLYSIGNLTQEQYDYIPIYEAKVREYNEQAVVWAAKVQLIQNKLIDEEAKVAFHTSALTLDTERWDNARELRANLTAGNAGIEVKAIKPEMLLLKSDSNNTLSGKYVDITLEGVDSNTVHLYQTVNYATTGDERLTDEVEGIFEYNEFNNLYRISNISSNETRLYMTCVYYPGLYYDNIITTWKNRMEKDRVAKAAAEKQVKAYYLQLYGADADYARVGYARVGYGIVDYDNNGNLVTKYKTSTGHALMYSYEQWLQKKNLETMYFERLMGPALREGYWQPEDYNDYGNKFMDSVTIPYTAQSARFSNITDHTTRFIWDSVPFDDETTYSYEVGVNQEKNYHLAVDLSSYKASIRTHLTDLSFIYYDKRAYTLNESVRKNSSLTDEQKTKLYKQNLNAGRRSLTIGGGCEFAFVKRGTSNNYIPILLLTGDSALTTEQKEFITSEIETRTTGDYRPYLGVISTKTTNSGVSINIATIIKPNLTFIQPDEIQTYLNSDTGLEEPRLVYPRIEIPSLSLKVTEPELLVKTNTQSLEMYKDYTVLARSYAENEAVDAYYITLKPETLLVNGINNTIVYLSYALSNADVAIYLDALEVLKENAKPKVSYEVKLNVINSNFMRTTYNKLNRVVNINDYELQLEDTHGYISSLTLNLDKPQEDTAEIKNYTTKFDDLFSKIVAQSEAMKKNQNTINFLSEMISPRGGLSSSLLQESILKADLNYAFNQGKLTIDEKNGIWGVSDAGVVAMRGGGIFTATEKDENGNWVWNTGILPSGINADLITSGQLDTNRIKVYAGDKIRFQLNGEGLFAYKSLIADETVVATATANAIVSGSNTQDLDYKQYVTFNENGLWLVAKSGSYVLNSAGTGYTKINSDVNRVELSWSGFKLRNWDGETVFYADPDTGNLHLTGTIIADEGRIGGWTILADRLEGRYISFINSSNTSTNGIFLTNNGAVSSDTITYNGTTYYIYNTASNGSGTTYYHTSNSATINVTSAWYYPTEVVSVTPKYLISEEVETDATRASAQGSSSTVVDDETVTSGTSGNSSTTTTKYVYYVYYIGKNNSTALTYTSGGTSHKIRYDGSTNITASWYTTLKNNVSNYTPYVNEQTQISSTLTKKSFGSSTTLYQQKFTPTFSVKAADGDVTIRKGTLGNFTLTSSALQNGTLKNVTMQNSTISNITLAVGSASYDLKNYGTLVSDITLNQTTGQFTLKRMNGSTANFNLANTAFFRNAVLAASEISVSTKMYKDNSRDAVLEIIATAPASTSLASQWGISPYTNTIEYGVGYLYAKGYSAGQNAAGFNVSRYGSGWLININKSGGHTSYQLNVYADWEYQSSDHTYKITVAGGGSDSAVYTTNTNDKAYNQGWNECLAACLATSTPVTSVGARTSETLFRQQGSSFSSVGNNWYNPGSSKTYYTLDGINSK